MLLVTRRVCALDDRLCLREATIEVALLDEYLLECPAREGGVEQGLGGLVFDLHLRRKQRLTVFMCEKENRLGYVTHLVHGETWLVALDKCDAVFTGDVVVVRCDVSRGVEATGHGDDPSARNGGPHGASIQHARKAKVVDVSCLA